MTKRESSPARAAQLAAAWRGRPRERAGAGPSRAPSARSLPRVALILFGLSPIASLGLGDSALGWLLRSWFELQCFRDPSRLLGMVGVTLPLCSRCAGLYFGLALGAAWARPRLRRSVLLTWFGCSLLIMLLDVLSEQLGMRPAASSLRLATGLLVAYPASVLAVTGGLPNASRAA